MRTYCIYLKLNYVYFLHAFPIIVFNLMEQTFRKCYFILCFFFFINRRSYNSKPKIIGIVIFLSIFFSFLQ